MLAIKGIYDGNSIILLDKVDIQSKRNVIVTFLDDINDTEMDEIRIMSSTTNGFEFWSDENEDLYQEYLQ